MYRGNWEWRVSKESCYTVVGRTESTDQWHSLLGFVRVRGRGAMYRWAQPMGSVVVCGGKVGGKGD
jgi:hypothetical protein